MEGLHDCVWRTAVFFVVANRDHFTELQVVITKPMSVGQMIGGRTPPAPSPSPLQDSYGLLVVFLILVGIEHGLLYLRSLWVAEEELDDHRIDIRSSKDNFLITEEQDGADEVVNVSKELIEYVGSVEDDTSIKTLEELRIGSVVNNSLQPAADGTSGVYFMKDSSGMKIAVFKPADEEGKFLEDYDGGEIKPGCAPGEGYLKELAAFVLDKSGFHGVPRTALAQCTHDFNNDGTAEKKVGSLQQFVQSECTAEDMGWGKFTKRDVHKIGLLDCRIHNLDRHLGNILVTEDDDGEYSLVPIDHGLSLPTTISGSTSFEWLQFPQCKQPFDRDTVEYICSIDVDEDVQRLRKEVRGLKEESLEVMKICTIFTQRAVAKGLNLYQIGCMMSLWQGESEQSRLEEMYMRVRQRAADGESERFWEVVEEEIEGILG